MYKIRTKMTLCRNRKNTKVEEDKQGQSIAKQREYLEENIMRMKEHQTFMRER